jgi:hypothetical protein
MEKKGKAPRRKPSGPADPAGELTSAELKSTDSSSSEEAVSMGRLSLLADAARRKIVRSPESEEDGTVSTQADLLKSRNKVEEVRKRIQTGYYGRPDIIGRIIDKLTDDLRP